MVTNTEIHYLPVDKSHTYALSRNTNHLRLDGQVSAFFRRQTTRVYFIAGVAPGRH